MSALSPTTKADWTINDLLRWTSSFLTEHDVDEPRLAGEVLLARAANCQRIDLYARFDQVLPAEQLSCFREWIRRASNHEPIAYIVGEKEFFSLAFTVTPDVLIPRPETETLVECAVDHCKAHELDQPGVLEIGTGSGCVAIALLKNLSAGHVVATDVSPAALQVAKQNAERHGLTDRLTLVEADGLDIPKDSIPTGGFDLLLSNPPYVSQEDLKDLDACVRDYEPRSALSDDGDGLSFYRSFGSDSASLLAPGGAIMVEIGDGMASAVLSVMSEPGKLSHRKTLKDSVVGSERVLVFAVEEG